MVAFVDGLSNRVISPGSPVPITFGMGNGPSMSLNPGAGIAGTDVQGYDTTGGTSFGGSGPAMPAGAAPSGQGNTGVNATNLASVNVSGTSTPYLGSSGFNSLNQGPAGNTGIMPPTIGGLHVTNLAPTNVKAQMPVQPSMLDQAWMWSNDHKAVSNAAQGALGSAIPLLAPVMSIANAYENYKHGLPLLQGQFGGLGSLVGPVSSLFSGLGHAPGGPLASTSNNPLYGAQDAAAFQGPPGGASYGGAMPNSGILGAPSIASSGALPAYPGLTGLSGGSAPLGGYWNQQAIRDAAPAYGPYAGMRIPSSIPSGLAPTGIQTLGA